jgi:hypothetical protein
MIARCSCGNVELEVTGKPLICVACHCADCHEGSRQIEALPNAAPILDSYGGTPHNLYRKDRMRYLKGTELLKSLKVDDDSPKRVYTTCCNSYMLLDVPAPMHWAPVNRARFQGEIPPLEMRINVKPKPGVINTPNDVPTYPSFPAKFLRRLLGAWLATVFRR